MRAQTVVALGGMAPDGCVLDRPVHSLDLAIRPRVVRIGHAMVDVVLRAGQGEGVAAKERLVGEALLGHCRCPAFAFGVVEGVAFSVSTVWMRYGTAAISRRRKSAETRRVARSCRWARATWPVRSTATSMEGLPCPVHISAISM